MVAVSSARPHRVRGQICLGRVGVAFREGLVVDDGRMEAVVPSGSRQGPSDTLQVEDHLVASRLDCKDRRWNNHQEMGETPVEVEAISGRVEEDLSDPLVALSDPSGVLVNQWADLSDLGNWAAEVDLVWKVADLQDHHQRTEVVEASADQGVPAVAASSSSAHHPNGPSVRVAVEVAPFVAGPVDGLALDRVPVGHLD